MNIQPLTLLSHSPFHLQHQNNKKKIESPAKSAGPVESVPSPQYVSFEEINSPKVLTESPHVKPVSTFSMPEKRKRGRPPKNPADRLTGKKKKEDMVPGELQRKGEWSNDERERYMSLLELKRQGESWVKFSRRIPGRSGSQCSDLFRKRMLQAGEVKVENQKIVLTEKGKSELYKLREELSKTSECCSKCKRWYPKRVELPPLSIVSPVAPRKDICISCERGVTPQIYVIDNTL